MQEAIGAVGALASSLSGLLLIIRITSLRNNCFLELQISFVVLRIH